MTTAKKTIAKRIRWLWWGKWSGVILCVLIVGLWVLSAFRGIMFTRYQQNILEQFNIVAGCVMYSNVLNPKPVPASDATGWSSASLGGTPNWIVSWLPRMGRSAFALPLWNPLLILALPTIGLFILDHRRRTRADCCAKCGYFLTGNISGMCPECGAKVGAPKSA